MVEERGAPTGRCSSSKSLIDACQNGDAEALKELVASYRDRVYAIALHDLGDEVLAADVTQETFLKVLRHIRQFRGEAQLITWLYRIVINTCRSHRRRAQRYVALAELASGPALINEARQETQVVRRQSVEELKSAILALSPALRAPLLLRYVAGLSYEEIGATLALPGGTVASRLARAHRALGKKLGHLRGTGRTGVCPW